MSRRPEKIYTFHLPVLAALLIMAGSSSADSLPVAMRAAEPVILGGKRGLFESLRLRSGTTRAVRFHVGERMPVFISAEATGPLEWSLHPAGGAAGSFAALPAGRSYPVAGGNAAAVAGEWELLLRNVSAQERFCTLELLTGACQDRGTGNSRAAAEDMAPSLSSPMRLRRMGAQGMVDTAGGDWWKFKLPEQEQLQFSFSGVVGSWPQFTLTNAAGEAVIAEDGAFFAAGDYYIQITGTGSRYGVAVIAGVSLEGRLSYAGYAAPGAEESETAAFLADFGANTLGQANVARMIRHWNPSYIISGGDNIYGTAAQIAPGSPLWKTHLSDYYGEFMMRRTDGKYPGQISPHQRFFPSLGNHDTTNTGGGGGTIEGYLDFFHHNPGGEPRLPGNGGALHHAGESYYQLRRGAVEWVMMDGDHARFSAELMERQKDWARATLAASDAPWRFVVEHYPPWTSGGMGRGPEFRWLETADAQAILSGDSHVYERLETNGPAAIVCGTGGATLSGFGAIITQSRVRHHDYHGAIRITSNPTGVHLHYRDVNDGANGGNGGRTMDPFAFGDLKPQAVILPEQWGSSDDSPLVLATFTPGDSALDLKAAALNEGDGPWREDDNAAPDQRNARFLADEAATFLLRLQQQSAAGGAFEVVMLTPWELWQHDHLRHLSAASAAPEANPDGDEQTNLLEYALGTDPMQANAVPSSLTRQGDTLTLTYTRPSKAPGITYMVEWNDSLAADNWSSTGVSLHALPDENAPATASLPAGSAGRRYVRLRIVRTP